MTIHQQKLTLYSADAWCSLIRLGWKDSLLPLGGLLLARVPGLVTIVRNVHVIVGGVGDLRGVVGVHCGLRRLVVCLHRSARVEDNIV